MRSDWIQYATVFIRNDSPGGRLGVICQYIEEQLLAYLEERPLSYLDDLVYKLFDEFDLVVDESTEDSAPPWLVSQADEDC